VKSDELLVKTVSLIPFVFLAAIFVFLVYQAVPSIFYNGLRFFTSYVWNPGMTFEQPVKGPFGFEASPGATFGVLLFLFGTLITSALAISLVVPVTLLTSVALALYVPRPMAKVISSSLQLFAAVPSVVYGLWGVSFLEPALLKYVFPWSETALGFIPWFRGPATSGSGIVASASVLVLMVLPITSSIVLDTFMTYQSRLQAPILSLGATKAETGFVILRLIKRQVIGATFLGLARALGETMAVLMTCGGAINSMPSSIYSPVNTMAAAIASLLDSAFIDPSGMTLSALAEVGLLLMVISLASSAIGKAMTGRVALRGEVL